MSSWGWHYCLSIFMHFPIFLTGRVISHPSVMLWDTWSYLNLLAELAFCDIPPATEVGGCCLTLQSGGGGDLGSTLARCWNPRWGREGSLSLLGRGGSSSFLVVSAGTTVVVGLLLLDGCKNLKRPLRPLWHPCSGWGRTSVALWWTWKAERLGSSLDLDWHRLDWDIGAPICSLVRVDVSACHLPFAVPGRVWQDHSVFSGVTKTAWVCPSAWLNCRQASVCF